MPKLPPQWVKCVFFIYASKRDAERAAESGGTGFIVAVPSEAHQGVSYSYLITNRHVVEGRKKPTIRLNRSNSNVELVETSENSWELDPLGEDIAVRPLDFDLTQYDQLRLPTNDWFLTESDSEAFKIGAGDEVALIGRFTKGMEEHKTHLSHDLAT